MEFSQIAFDEAISVAVTVEEHTPDCEYLLGQFRDLETTSRDEGKLEVANAYWFLGAICTLTPSSDDRNYPFTAGIRFAGGRSPILDDFTDAQIEASVSSIERVSDPDLRARIGDIGWVRLRKHESARVAVEAYIESAERFLQSSIMQSKALDRYERAMQVAGMLGRNQPLFAKVVDKVRGLTRKDHASYLVAPAMDLLLEANVCDMAELAEFAMERAQEREPDANDGGVWQIRFFGLAEKFYSRNKDEEKSRTAIIKMAETYETIADQRSAQGVPGNHVAMDWLEKAIQVLRRVPATEAERDRLHKKLLTVQQVAVREFPNQTSKLDLSDCRKSATEAIEGKTLTEALQHLAFAFPVPKKSRLISSALDSFDTYKLAHLFPRVKLGTDGKVVHKSGTMRHDDSDAATTLHAYELFGLELPVLVGGVIEPIRQKIVCDFNVRIDDLKPYYEYNSFVPPGREWFFAKGIHAGLTGDFATALHLLVPQLENSLRDVLNQRSVVTSSLDIDGIQNEHNLNQLLYGETGQKVEEIFGVDIVFVLRALLVEKCSTNLRNRLAHGMLSPGHCFDYPAVYVWWLVLHICACGVAR